MMYATDTLTGLRYAFGPTAEVHVGQAVQVPPDGGLRVITAIDTEWHSDRRGFVAEVTLGKFPAFYDSDNTREPRSDR